jgi:hypothetical protein
MNSTIDSLQQHQKICDELYELALEENRFLQQNRRSPSAEFLDRKRALLRRLDAALAALRTPLAGDARRPGFRGTLDKTRSRILQILQLDRENEQLLTRYSLSRTGGGSPDAGYPPPPLGMLQSIYARHS